LLPPHVLEVVQPFYPPVHEVQEATTLNDEFKESVEDVHASFPPSREDKEMITFVDGLLREPLHMFDEHIDTFI
jgi:hypothetical protein